MYLLGPTCVVEFHHDEGGIRSEVCRRIVEAQMRVFPDPDKRDVQTVRRQLPAETLTFSLRVFGIAIDETDIAGMHPIDEPPPQIPAETRRM